MKSVFTSSKYSTRTMSGDMAFSARRNNTVAENFCENGNAIIIEDTASAVSFVVIDCVVRILLVNVVVRLIGIIISAKNGTAYQKKLFS